MNKYLTTESEGRPICVVKGGKYDKKLISIVNKPKENNTREERKGGGMSFIGGDENDEASEDLKEIIAHISKYDKSGRLSKLIGAGAAKKKMVRSAAVHATEIVDHAGKFSYIPNDHTREVLYICGPSGSGKSFYAAEYVKKWNKLFPDWPIFLFSSKDEDKQLDDLGVKRIQINDELLTDMIDYKDLANSLCIFDDVDALEGTRFAKPIFGLRDTLLKNARSQNTYVISTIHEMFGYKTTRTSLSEAHAITFFPNNGSDFAIKKYLKTRAGLDAKTIDTIFKLESRWVTLYSHSPRFILWEYGVKIL